MSPSLGQTHCVEATLGAPLFGQRTQGSFECVRRQSQAGCLLEVCYGAVWVVDAPWGRGVFSAERLPCANLTSVQELK